jgi:hypothetical protein
MENGEPPRAPLTDEEKILLTNELPIVDGKISEILRILDINDPNEFPEVVQYANSITDPEGDQLKFKKDVRDAEQLLKNITGLKVSDRI